MDIVQFAGHIVNMLEITREIIEEKIKEESGRVAGVTDRLREHGNDGDKFDDPLMHADHGNLLSASNRRKSLQNASVQENQLVLDEIDYDNQVGLYSAVNLEVQFLDDLIEQWELTIGTTEDAEHIGRWERYSEFFDGDTKQMISNKSPIGTVLLGKSVRQKISVKIGDLKTLHILRTRLSELASGNF